MCTNCFVHWRNAGTTRRPESRVTTRSSDMPAPVRSPTLKVRRSPMKKDMARIATAALVLCTLNLTTSGAALAVEKEQTVTEKAVSAQGIDHLKVNVEIGPIHLIAEDGDSVQIKAVRVAEGGSAADRKRWLQEPRVTIQSQGDTLEVKDIIPESLRNHNSGRYNFNWPRGRDFKVHLDVDIRLPRRLIPELSTGIGDITVDGQANRITADTGVGAVRLTHLACGENPVSVHTGAGNVQMDGQVGALTAAAGAGNVTVVGEVRDLNIHDGAGRVDIDRVT